MYEVVVAPIASEILMEYAGRCAADNGVECAMRLTDCYDKAIGSLREMPQRGVRKLCFIHAIQTAPVTLLSLDG